MDSMSLSLGDVLRRARIERGLSIADVESALRIRQNYISALETDDFVSLPPAVYTRALIRDYARLLGLDPAEVLTRPLPMRATDRNPIRPAIQSTDKPPFVSMRAAATAGVIVICAVLFSYLYAQYNSYAQSVERQASASQALPTPQSRALSPLLTPAPTATQSPAPTAAPTATPVIGVVVDVRVVDRSWVQAWADGRPVVTGETMDAGTDRTIKADQNVRLRVGNAGGVDVTANGVPQGRLGASGEAIDATWARE
ncbi:MAG: putative transcriptional regulator [Chloroflexi bacterium]|nr:putative transcriptional regulator [Chloroflexota bacterium]